MTKEELLADLLGRDFIRSIATPKAQSIYEDGTIPYQVNVCEVSQKSAVYRNVSFYVMDEGLEGEAAYYMNGDVKRTLENTEFKDFVHANFKTALPKVIDYSWVSFDNDKRSGIIKCVIPDESTPGENTVKGYLVADNNGTLIMLPMSLSADIAVGVNNI